MATKKPAKKSVKNTVSAAAKNAASRAKASKLSGHGSGFMSFVREQGVVGLAVGLAIGTAAGATVKTLVEGFITPVVQFIVGSTKGLEAAVWHVDLWGRTADFKWGAFVSSAITLLATAFVIYLIVHYMKLDRLDKKKD